MAAAIENVSNSLFTADSPSAIGDMVRVQDTPAFDALRPPFRREDWPHIYTPKGRNSIMLVNSVA